MSDIDALKPSLESIAKAVSDVSTSLKGGSDSMASYRRAAADARVKIAELTASGKTMGAAFKDAEAQLKSNENAWKAHNQAMKATEEQFKKLEKECETVTDKYAKLNAAATAFYGKLAQGIAAVTGTTISFAKAKDSLLGFNNAMFGASRSYQMFGKDLGDVNKVFEGITKNTTYSKREFTELANSIISSWKGVPPSFTELGKILETVGKQFGHNKEQVKDVPVGAKIISVLYYISFVISIIAIIGIFWIIFRNSLGSGLGLIWAIIILLLSKFNIATYSIVSPISSSILFSIYF